VKALKMELQPIGVIHSPYKEIGDAPPQGRMKKDAVFQIEVFPQFVPGLKDLDTATHIIVLYWLDKADREKLVVKTPWDEEPHGVFATRSPSRPNPIAFDIADLVEVKKNILFVRGLDALEGSPLIDIKPYSQTDSVPGARLGWFEKAAQGKNNPF
jgi:tRNA-Thr(GGU) m(6)t(6)A37 methyltransferase TsaA